MNSSRPKGDVFRFSAKSPPRDRVKKLRNAGDKLWWIYILPSSSRDALPVTVVKAGTVSSYVRITGRQHSGRTVCIMNTNLVPSDVATSWCKVRR